MIPRLFTLGILAAGLSTGLAHSADDKAPRWKATGPYFAVVTQTTARTTSTPTEDKTDNLKATFIYQVTQVERRCGRWNVELVLKRVVGDGPDLDYWKKCVDVPVTMECDEGMAFKKLRGMDKFVDKFAGDEETTEAERKMVTDLLTDAVMNHFGDAFVPLPTAKPTTVKRTGGIAGLLTAETERVYALPKVERGGNLAYRFEGTEKMAVGEDQTVAPFKITKLEEKQAAKSTGTVWFDPALGRPVRFEKAVSFEIAMVVSAGGQEADVTVAEKSAVAIRFVAEMPPDDR